MKKENKKLAQEQRAMQRKKEELKNRIKNILKFAVPAFAVILLIVFIIWNPFEKITESTDGTYTPDALDETLTYYADIDIAEYGKITVKLDQKSAPISAANFVALAKTGFMMDLHFTALWKAL